MLAKVIVRRLEVVLPGIISQEQTSFYKGQIYKKKIIRMLFNIVYSQQFSNPPRLVISLDAEKASDRIEWEYLFAVLKTFRFWGQI